MDHINASFIVGQSHNQTVSTNHNFLREKRAKAELQQGPSACQPSTLLLGQTGLPLCTFVVRLLVSDAGGGGGSTAYVLYKRVGKWQPHLSHIRCSVVFV